jgi:hypothetical protein
LNVSDEHTKTFMDLVWSEMTKQNWYAKWLKSICQMVEFKAIECIPGSARQIHEWVYCGCY